MQMPNVNAWDFHAVDLCDGIRKMLDENKRQDPFLLALPGFSETLSIILANGPEVGLPFVISIGVPRHQQKRYHRYFLHVWDEYAERPAEMPREGCIRHELCVDSPERDRMGLAVRPHPIPDKLMGSCRALRLLRDRWPGSAVAQMLLTISPVGLGRPFLA